MLKGISTSDFHLGALTRVLPSPVDSILTEVHKPYLYAIEKGIKHVFVPGDMSDTERLDEHTFIRLVQFLLTYDGTINTYYILGNHDFASTERTSLDVLKMLESNNFFKSLKIFYEPTVLKIEGERVCFMPYPHTELPTSKAKLIFAHIDTPGAIGDNGYKLKTKEDKIAIGSKDYLISGHIHQYQYLKNKRTLYNGSLFQKNFGESLPKGFVEFKYDGDLKFRFVSSKPEFRLVTKVIEKPSDWDDLSKDQSIRYKVLVKESVLVPKNITTSYPNICMLKGNYTEKLSNPSEITHNFKSVPKISPISMLKTYLKTTSLNKNQRIRALGIVKDILPEIKNEYNSD